MPDRDDEGRTARPPGGGTTSNSGTASNSEAPPGPGKDGPGKDELIDLGLPPRPGRITMDFSGPPLELPEAISLPPDEPDSLQLDLDEVDSDAIDLVDRTRPSEIEIDLREEMRECFTLDDFTGALGAALLLIGKDPDDQEAAKIADACRQRLDAMYTGRLGGTHQVPSVQVPETELRWLGLDHRAAFLLSRMDGVMDIEALLDVCGMPRLEALQTLVELTELGAIRLT